MPHVPPHPPSHPTHFNNKLPLLLTHTTTELLEAPRAPTRPHALEAHGDVREDAYYWLRDDDRKEPQVIAHLKVGSGWGAPEGGCWAGRIFRWARGNAYLKVGVGGTTTARATRSLRTSRWVVGGECVGAEWVRHCAPQGGYWVGSG